MKIGKLSFKRIALVASLALAGLFGVSSLVISNSINKQSVAIEAKADTPSVGLYEKIGNTTYRVIYFHNHTSWERGNCFGTDGDWKYLYSTDGGSNYSTVQFKNSDSYSTNEIIGDYTAKIYLPENVTHIRFRSYSTKTTKSYNTYALELSGSYSNREAFWVNRDNYDVSITGTDNATEYALGEWISESAFLNRFYTMYFTSTNSSWVSNASLSNAYIRCSYLQDSTGEGWGQMKNSPTQGTTAITSSMINAFDDGTKYVKFLVPKDCNQVWMEKSKKNTSEGANTGAFVNPIDNYLYVVTSNNWYSVQDTTFVDIDKSSYRQKSIGFARFYFCEGSWGSSTNPRIGTSSLETSFASSTLFSSNSVDSSYAETSFPSSSYYYIDYTINSNSSCYFRFEQSGANIYPSNQGYSGYIGNYFSPGYIYTITAGNYTGASGSNKWCDISVNTIGVIGQFDNDGGTRNPAETKNKDYKEFRYNTGTALLKTPSKSGYTFMGWEPSSNPYINKAEAEFTVTSSGTPVFFKAIWISNTQMVVPSGRARLWIGYNGTVNGSLYYKGSDITNLAVIKIKINNGSGTNRTYNSSGTFYNSDESIDGSVGCPRRYDYFDIEQTYFTNGWYFNVMRYDNNGQSVWTESKFWGTLSEGNLFNIFYCPSDWEASQWYDFYGLSASNSTFATIALCGMHTCDSSAFGYGSYDEYYSTFGKSSSIVSGMSSYSIIDFENGSDYTSDEDINKVVSAYQKYQLIQYNASSGSRGVSGLAHFNGLLSTDSDIGAQTIIIIVVSNVSILSITALSVLIVKKRKTKEQ